MNTNRFNIHGGILFGMLILNLFNPTEAFAAQARITTLAPTNVTATSALLKATANPGGTSTDVRFEWGPGDTYSNTSPATNIGTGSGFVSVSLPIGGLSPGVTYHGRGVASNSVGVVRGKAVAFGVPALLLNGSNPQSVPLNVPFTDPGAVPHSTLAELKAGAQHNVALQTDGTLRGWGGSGDGQIAFTNAATNLIAIAAGNFHSLALRASGSVVGYGLDTDGQASIPANATNAVIGIAAGGYHSVALKSNGTVVAWGATWDGQTNIPNSATNVIGVAAGRSHSLALLADGTVAGWGGENNIDTPATVPPAATNIVAIAAGGDQSLALTAAGLVIAWGWDNDDQITTPSEATNIVAIAAGYTHCLALKRNGSVLAWGLDDNNTGKLVVPPEATNVIAIAAGLDHSLALRMDGTVVSWGINSADPQIDMPTNLTTLNLSVGVAGTVNTSVAGSYPLLYSATNAYGSPGTAARTVHVVTIPVPEFSQVVRLGNGAIRLTSDYTTNVTLTVLAATNMALPVGNWSILGQATESPAGHYEFTDADAPNHARRFYRLATPLP